MSCWYTCRGVADQLEGPQRRVGAAQFSGAAISCDNEGKTDKMKASMEMNATQIHRNPRETSGGQATQLDVCILVLAIPHFYSEEIQSHFTESRQPIGILHTSVLTDY